MKLRTNEIQREELRRWEQLGFTDAQGGTVPNRFEQIAANLSPWGIRVRDAYETGMRRAKKSGRR